MYGGTSDRKWSNSLRCRELRLEGTRFSIKNMDSEICIMRTSGCKREENWKKIRLLAYDYEGKKESVIKKQDK
jgi:hypothetical protein